MKDQRLHIYIVCAGMGVGCILIPHFPLLGWPLAIISGAEIGFRFLWLLRKKQFYEMKPSINVKNLAREPMPYIPFSYKKNAHIPEIPHRGPYHTDYTLYDVKTNSHRISNGPDGGREIAIPKPEGLIRINCLGASTTANYIKFQNQHYSYPIELEKILQAKYPKHKIEVNNFGHGGWNSADILVDFLLKGIDTNPDIVVIYHAYNDLPMSLTDNFDSDYSHYKRNFELAYYLINRASRFPKVPLALYDYFIFKTMRRSICSENGIVADINTATSKTLPNIDNPFRGLSTYKRNLEHIINACRANNIKVVLSTFCYFPPLNFELNKVLVKYKKGLEQENEVIRELAQKYRTGFVDATKSISLNDENFKDSIHFSHIGMKVLAEKISEPLCQYINRFNAKREEVLK